MIPDLTTTISLHRDDIEMFLLWLDLCDDYHPPAEMDFKPEECRSIQRCRDALADAEDRLLHCG